MTTASAPDQRGGDTADLAQAGPDVMALTIVNVALGRLSEDFHAPVATIQWVATGYTLALATVAVALMLLALLLPRKHPQ